MTAQKECPEILKLKAVVNGSYYGWIDFNAEVEKAGDHFRRPTGAEATNNEDISILYFTSGTTSLPKMVLHNFAYPLGHIITAKYWQNVMDDGLHYTVADTGWAKAVWGKIYGQWIAGSAVFAYDYEVFNPVNLLEEDAGLQGHDLLCPAHDLPVPHQRGPEQVRFLQHEVLCDRRRAAEP